MTDLYNQLNKLQRGAIAGAVARRLAGDPGEPQDPAEATYTCSRVPGDGEIVWSRSTQETDRLVRALTPPFPGAYTFLGTRRLWIRKATIRADSPRYEGRIPGRPVGRAPRGWVDVLTGDGVLRVHEVQLDGEATRPAAEVIRSVKQTLGLRAEDLLARILQLESDQHYGQGRVRDDSQS